MVTAPLETGAPNTQIITSAHNTTQCSRLKATNAHNVATRPGHATNQQVMLQSSGDTTRNRDETASAAVVKVDASDGFVSSSSLSTPGHLIPPLKLLVAELALA